MTNNRLFTRVFGPLVNAVVFSVFSNILMLTGPMFMLLVYDRVLGSRSEETLVALFMLVGALFALFGLLEFARGRLLARAGARVQSTLQRRVFSGVVDRAGRHRAARHSDTALQDLESVHVALASPVALALLDLPWVPIFIAVIFIFHPWLGWFAIAGGIVLVAIALMNQLVTARKVKASATLSAEAANFAKQAEYGSELVVGQGMEEAVADRWVQMRDRATQSIISTNDWTGSFGSASKTIRLFLQSAILALGAYLVLQDQMTAGAMIAASILLSRALAPIEQSIGQWPLAQRALTGWRQLRAFLEDVPEETPSVRLPRPKSHLAVSRLTVAASTPGQRPVLRNIEFEVGPGEVVGVIGKSGAGKTTLARTLVGIVPPAVGSVRLGGATLDQYSNEHLGELIGYLPQDVRMFDGTIAENIARLAPNTAIGLIIDAAKRARAYDLILRLPEGFDTPVRAANALLSGGQRQRIALARALIGNPALLVLDEPNSALDNEGTIALQEAISDAKKAGKAVVMMTHRPTAVAICDRLIVMDQGQIATMGPREDIMRAMMQNAKAQQRAKQDVQPEDQISREEAV